MKHVIIGTGPAGIVAAETIRKLDASASITVIGNEHEKPYSRMAIPYLLDDIIDEQGTYIRKDPQHYTSNAIELVDDLVASVHPDTRQLVLQQSGKKIDYDRLLIATGSNPITPPIPGVDHPKVSNCWTLEDARKIAASVTPGSTVIQIGAGFIGCIILESLVTRGAALTVVEMGDRMVPRMLDQQCGTMLKNWCTSKGVRVLTSTQVTSIEDDGAGVAVKLSDGQVLKADYVITSTGVKTNTGFLEGSGININSGVRVNQYLETNIPGIYAAGDVAEGLDFSTGDYSVHAIQPTATEHGMIAAKNMVSGNTAEYKGSVIMNVLATMGLVSTSYGSWEGVKNGECAELVDTDRYRYIRLQFDGDRIVGANTLGITENIGALRGLIQSGVSLGKWKQQLMNNPLNFMEAYIASVKKV